MISYFLAGFLCLTAAAAENGKFTVVYAPKYVNFLSSASVLNTEEIPSVILSTLGLPLTQDIKWNGLAEGNPFRRPKANVLVTVLEASGTTEAFTPTPSQRSYPTSKADGYLDIDVVINSIQHENWKQEPFFVDFYSINLVPSIMSSAESRFARLQSSYHTLRESLASDWLSAARLGALNSTEDTDLQLIGELYTILGILDDLKQNPEVVRSHAPDFLHFTLSGLQAVQSVYGQNSPQLLSARHLVNDFIGELRDRVRGMYKDGVVVALVSAQSPSAEGNLVRKTRSLMESSELASNRSLNLAPAFTYMYAPIFNIVLWVMIGFALAVFGISWGVWNMDPGRDSLIYRMTSQRMKRD